MPLFRLSERLEFPPAWLARSDGLLCIGGDLSCERILLAYKNGIFPWFSDNEPILWWSPEPRLVLFPEDIHASKSLNKNIKQKQFDIRVNTAFEKTIRACAQSRKTGLGSGTWLVEEMIDAYIELHRLGYAHSIEAWQKAKLVGGLYGICLGGIFFGESMFSTQKNASKVALVTLANLLNKNSFDLIDCQVTTDHLLSMGATEISRNDYLDIIKKSVKRQDIKKDIWFSADLLP
ncbi:MAG: leucyl/phenylalanyl-tRNA--protein transferase [Proteobacteria bacterium]|nr:leucyl/phenylalanyl-tRNA--protein transferase [Pseudomonadota bacterium]MBU1387664.1 leucyl/phenylalanyl-tRNA--protein transferase [Pseudomonadota bacterium]MBU1543696.1 leucyl/phenylalanyl-tRNA--protein transferase [Pseudomonadota bacterium]MBU2429275.1 leucyl/phenylalanyl-tRNA--protein transferase [Pseudomonadota bacterium]MBU2482567.1 leucyl/phenylalanyl-tRNA--protein transferase [Pseudomonadota bacterium]